MNTWVTQFICCLLFAAYEEYIPREWGCCFLALLNLVSLNIPRQGDLAVVMELSWSCSSLVVLIFVVEHISDIGIILSYAWGSFCSYWYDLEWYYYSDLYISARTSISNHTSSMSTSTQLLLKDTNIIQRVFSAKSIIRQKPMTDML